MWRNDDYFLKSVYFFTSFVNCSGVVTGILRVIGLVDVIGASILKFSTDTILKKKKNLQFINICQQWSSGNSTVQTDDVSRTTVKQNRCIRRKNFENLLLRGGPSSDLVMGGVWGGCDFNFLNWIAEVEQREIFFWNRSRNHISFQMNLLNAVCLKKKNWKKFSIFSILRFLTP